MDSPTDNMQQPLIQASNHILVVVWSCRITQRDLVARSKLCLMGLRPEIGRSTIHTGNDSGVRCDAVNTCYKIGFNDAQKSIYAVCPAGDFTGPVLVNSNTTRIDNQTQ